MGHDTLRNHMARQLRIIVAAGAPLGLTNTTYDDLVAGRTATLTRGQLDMVGAHLSKTAAGYAESPAQLWELDPNDTLVPL